MKIFIPVVGQFTNIGDVLHRREFLKWIQPAGQLHVYVGAAPKSFVDGLKLDDGNVIYTNLWKWMGAICLSGYGKTVFAFNPGEIRLGNKRMKGEILLFPIQLLVRLKAGHILRVGIAAMSNSKTSLLWFWKFLLLPTTILYWRTLHSQRLFKRGKVIPDLAFSDVTATDFISERRKILAVSMRVDRVMPSDNWFTALQKFANDNNYTLKVVSQVRMDNSRTLEISQRLKCEGVIWPDHFSHLDQEKVLNKIYDETVLVLSDRLHVLIAAYSKGAVPANILSAPSEKVQHHFSVVGLENVSIVEDGKSVEELYAFLSQKVKQNNRDILSKSLLEAKQSLEDARLEILKKIK